MKVAIHHDPNWTLYAEYVWFGVILHCDMFRWDAATKHRFRHKLLDIVKGYGSRSVYAFATEGENPKLHKFIQIVGGRFEHTQKLNGERFSFYRFSPLN